MAHRGHRKETLAAAELIFSFQSLEMTTASCCSDIYSPNPRPINWLAFFVHVLKILVVAIGHFGKYHNILCLPPKFCISIVSSFSWDLQWSQENTKTMLMQNLGGQTKSIMVFSEVAYSEMIHPEQLFPLSPRY